MHQNKHYAIAHFNVWNAEMLMGVIDAAEEAIRRLLSPWNRICKQYHFEDFHMYDGVSMAKKPCAGNTHWDRGRSMDIIHTPGRTA